MADVFYSSIWWYSYIVICMLSVFLWTNYNHSAQVPERSKDQQLDVEILLDEACCFFTPLDGIYRVINIWITISSYQDHYTKYESFKQVNRKYFWFYKQDTGKARWLQYLFPAIVCLTTKNQMSLFTTTPFFSKRFRTKTPSLAVLKRQLLLII